jgi:hypothetical protein
VKSHVVMVLMDPAAGHVDRFRATGDVAEQSKLSTSSYQVSGAIDNLSKMGGVSSGVEPRLPDVDVTVSRFKPMRHKSMHASLKENRGRSCGVDDGRRTPHNCGQTGA